MKISTSPSSSNNNDELINDFNIIYSQSVSLEDSRLILDL